MILFCRDLSSRSLDSKAWAPNAELSPCLPPWQCWWVTPWPWSSTKCRTGFSPKAFIAGSEECWKVWECCTPGDVGAAGSWAGLKPQVGLCCLSTDCPKQRQKDFSPLFPSGILGQSSTPRNIGYFTHGQIAPTRFNPTSEAPRASLCWEQHRL